MSDTTSAPHTTITAIVGGCHLKLAAELTIIMAAAVGQETTSPLTAILLLMAMASSDSGPNPTILRRRGLPRC